MTLDSESKHRDDDEDFKRQKQQHELLQVYCGSTGACDVFVLHAQAPVRYPRHTTTREHMVDEIQLQTDFVQFFVRKFVPHHPEQAPVQPGLRIVVEKLRRQHEQQRPGVYPEKVFESLLELVAYSINEDYQRHERDDIDYHLPVATKIRSFSHLN